MTTNKMTENKIKEETQIYKDLIKGILEEYEEEFKRHYAKENIKHTLDIVDQEINLNKVTKDPKKLDPIKETVKYKDLIPIKYLRLAEISSRFYYTIPDAEDFALNFRFQLLNTQKKQWEEKLWSNDIPNLPELISKQHVRVENQYPPKTRLLFTASYIKTDEPEHVQLNRVYKDLLYHLIAGGVEHLSMLSLQREKIKEEQSKEQKTSNITTRKHMPAPLTKEDKKYANWVKEQKKKGQRNKKEKPKE